VNLATGLRAWADILDHLDRPITKEWLSEFIGDAEEHATALAGSIWGSIRWHKDLGRPMAIPAARAFTLRQEVRINIVYVDEEGQIDHWVTWDMGSPTVWDGPDDSEYYRVSYCSLGSSADGKTYMRAALSPGGWPRTTVAGGVHRIVPPEYAFDWTGAAPIVLPEQEVLLEDSAAAGGLWRLVWTT
jgi:hypothetical protein